jgi:hypothetical protein
MIGLKYYLSIKIELPILIVTIAIVHHNFYFMLK